jgi:hypothetical protein
MIPKPLNEITWSDIEALRDSGREEDDMIEYKGSFSGGSDFLAFNDSQRNKAVDGIAKEAIAFLNGRGGDIIIGVKEAANDHPKIEVITPIANVDATADCLGQALAALIEPTQSVLGVRAVRQSDGDSGGVIVVRAPSSLRAPHRSTRSKECYVRRGRESVPMPMDEVQNLTLRRADSQNERLALFDAQFSDLASTLVGRHTLEAHRIHFRSCFVPLNRLEFDLNEPILGAFRGRDPELDLNGKRECNDVAFRQLSGKDYRPILRGMVREALTARAWSDNDFFYASKVVRSDGLMRTDFACRTNLSNNNNSSPSGFHMAWIAGYFANTIASITAVQKQIPLLSQGVLRIAIHSDGPITMGVGDNQWSRHLTWPTSTLFIPDFEVTSPDALFDIFQQLQIDVASIAGLTNPLVYSFASN